MPFSKNTSYALRRRVAWPEGRFTPGQTNWLLRSQLPTRRAHYREPRRARQGGQYLSYTCGHWADFEAKSPRLKTNMSQTAGQFEIRIMCHAMTGLPPMLARCGGRALLW